MATLNRQAVLDVLQGPWATYVVRFQGLSDEAQAAFLARQGYARFADLLAHIIAWWEVGYHAIQNYLGDPEYRPVEYDIDAFNAAAVAKTRALDEALVVAAFEKMRDFLVEFVKVMPDAAFENERVIRQINMELVGHLADHDIPENG